MNRRSFLSAVARLGAAVVASPLAALLPEQSHDCILLFGGDRKIYEWRGRLVFLGHQYIDPLMWKMSAVGDNNWDLSRQ